MTKINLITDFYQLYFTKIIFTCVLKINKRTTTAWSQK